MSRNKSKRVKMPEGTHTLHMTDPHQKLIGRNHLSEPIYAHVSAPLVRQDGNVHMSKKERLRLRRQRSDALIEELNREPNVVKIEGQPTDDTGYRAMEKAVKTLIVDQPEFLKQEMDRIAEAVGMKTENPLVGMSEETRQAVADVIKEHSFLNKLKGVPHGKS